MAQITLIELIIAGSPTVQSPPTHMEGLKGRTRLLCRHGALPGERCLGVTLAECIEYLLLQDERVWPALHLSYKVTQLKEKLPQSLVRSYKTNTLE